VKLLLKPESPVGPETVRVPDLHGLSIREARRLLLGCGLRSQIRGAGVVRDQRPAPGTLVHVDSIVRITCDLKGLTDCCADVWLANGETH
jgi:hypothetical protein